MTARHGNDDPVGNEIPETAQAVLQLRERRISSMLRIIVINEFDNIAVEFFFCPDKGLDASLKCEGKKRIFPRHIFIEFPNLL